MTGPTHHPAGKPLRGRSAPQIPVAAQVPVAPVAACAAVGTLGPGSAGASVLAVALAAHVGGFLIEADADGGVAGARYGGWLHEGAPSLASLLVALDTPPGPGAGAVQEHFQRLPSGVRAALLAPGAEHALGSVRRLSEDLTALRAALPGRALVVDVGRVRPDSPAMALVQQADVLVAVVRPQVDSLGCLLARLPVLARMVARVVVAVRGVGPYPLPEIRTSVQMACPTAVSVVAVVDDPRGVALLGDPSKPGRVPGRGGRMSALMRSAADLAAVLSAVAPVRRPPPPPPAAAGAGALVMPVRVTASDPDHIPRRAAR